MLDIENGDEHKKEREGEFAQHLISLFRRFGPDIIHTDPQEDGKKHQEQILLDEIPDRQDNPDAFSYESGGPTHDQGNGKQRDDAAQGRQGDRQGHVATSQFGEYVRRAASRTAGDEYQTNEIDRRQV